MFLFQRCHWTISGPAHSLINLTLNSIDFATEPEHDRLNIFSEDQRTPASNKTLLRSFSGRLPTSTVSLISPASRVHLQFISDKSETGIGFLLHYTVIKQSKARTRGDM